MEFKRYIERREECEAVRYIDSRLAHWVATELFSTRIYQVNEESLVLTPAEYVSVAGPRNTDNQLIINQGDYIIREPGYEQLIIVPRYEFRTKWQEACG